MRHFNPDHYPNSSRIRLRQNIVRTLLERFGEGTLGSDRLESDLWQYVQNPNDSAFIQALDRYADSFIPLEQELSVESFANYLRRTPVGLPVLSDRVVGPILSQDVSQDPNTSANYFIDLSDVYIVHGGKTRFSRMLELEQCRRKDGLFHFLLEYHDSELMIEWQQRNNPAFWLEPKLDPDFKLVDVEGDHNEGQTFRGLRLNTNKFKLGAFTGSITDSIAWTVGAYRPTSGLNPRIPSTEGQEGTRSYTLYSV